jgi:hypothetical protein
MTLEHFNQIEKLLSLTEMGMAEKNELELIIRMYIDAGFSMCKTCDPQVRQAWKRLGNWWLLNRTNFHNQLFNKKKSKNK